MIVYQLIVDGQEQIISDSNYLILELFQDITYYSGYDQFARNSKDYKDHYIIVQYFPDIDGRYYHVKSGNESIQELYYKLNPHKRSRSGLDINP